MTKNRWFLPGFSALLGLLILGAFWLGDNPRDGVYGLGVMVGTGLLILLGGRSEMVRGLRGDGRDEYWERLDMRATLFSGMVAISTIIAMCLWEWAHGREGTPYVQLGAIAGVSYLVALGVLRVRG